MHIPNWKGFDRRGVHKADWLVEHRGARRISPPQAATVADSKELLSELASVDDGRRQWLEVPATAFNDPPS